MATSYPGAFDALTNPATTDPLTSPSHAGQHANANDAIEALQVRAGLTGTSFPGSPATGARFLRTDRNIEYFYDGTRWLSTTLYSTPIEIAAGTLPYSGDTTGWRTTAPFLGQYDIWLEDWSGFVFVSGGTALSASHKWTFQIWKQPGATSLSTKTLDSGSIGVFRSLGRDAIGALLGTTNFEIDVTAIKTGTPGSIFAGFRLGYRVVG